MRRLVLCVFAGLFLLVPVQAASAIVTSVDVVDYSWRATLSYEEANPQADPVSIRDEQGRTVSRFEYDAPDNPETLPLRRRRSVFATDQNRTVRSAATWLENAGQGFEEESCRDVDELDGGGGVTLRKRRKRVRLDWNLPIAISNCGPGVFDDRALDDALEEASAQRVPIGRFDANRVRIGFTASQPLDSSNGSVRGTLEWRARVVLEAR